MSTAAIYREVLAAMRRHVMRLALACIEVLLIAGLELLKPWPLKIVIDNVLGGRPLRLGRPLGLCLEPVAIPRKELLVFACGGLVGLYLLLALLQAANNYLTIDVGQRMVADLRARLFDHLNRLALSFHRRHETSDLMVRVTYDSYAIQAIAINGVFPVFASLVLLAGMFAAMAHVDLPLTLAALAIVPLLTVTIFALGPHIDRVAVGARSKESEVYNEAHRTLSAIEVMQAFTAEESAARQFSARSRASLSENLRLYVLQTCYGGAVNVVIGAGGAAVIYLGARQVAAGRLTIGGLVVFVTYLASLYTPISRLFQTYGNLHSAVAGLRRCMELLYSPLEIADRPDAAALGRPCGVLEFRGVTFRYGIGPVVLKGVTFAAYPGEMLAIVGPSGAGKTSLVRLMARFYEANSGVVAIDGRPIQALTLRSLRQALALVPQPPILVSGSIRANIALGNPAAGAAEIERAARLAQLEPLLKRMPLGIDQLVGQGGAQLSQGEAQRIAIARALLKDAPMLVMDEPTSALDPLTEMRIMEAVRACARQRTIIVIAHRLSTVRHADRILVLRGGRIEEQGSFSDLVARGGFFSYLYRLHNCDAGPLGPAAGE
jgi:ATP-binding cassette subfamily B protein